LAEGSGECAVVLPLDYRDSRKPYTNRLYTNMRLQCSILAAYANPLI
jgi:hypothetical protein